MTATVQGDTRSNRSASQFDWPLLAAVMILVIIGLMMVYSSTFGFEPPDTTQGPDPHYYFRRQVGWLLLGLLCMGVAARLRYPVWKKFSIPLILLTLVLLVAVAASGEVVHGSRRALFGNWAQPNELAKLAVIIYIGHWLASKGLQRLRKLPYGLIPFTIMVGIVAYLMVLQPDFSSAILITAVAVAMFFLAGADWVQFAVGLLTGGALFAFLISNFDYAAKRIDDWRAAWENPIVTGGLDQGTQALYALGSGGVVGVGPGNGRVKFGWLSMAHNDGIFAILGEELGLVGCLAVVGLFAFLAYRGFRIAARTQNPFGTLVASGITCWVTFQAVIHIGSNVRIVPQTGMPLPFMSAGGSSLVACLTGVGLLLSISRAIGTEDDQVPALAEQETNEDDGSSRRDRRARVSRSRRAARVADTTEHKRG